MQRHFWFSVREWLAGLALVLMSVGLVWADALAGDARPLGGAAAIAPAGVPVEVGEYWIGLACMPAGPALRAQLGLEEDQGLVVHGVVPESPAAEAGVEEHDVVVSAGGEPLATIQDLIDAVEKAEQEKLALELYRGGKLKKINVTPAKRPEEARPDRPGASARQQYWDLLREQLDQMRSREPGRSPMRFRFFHPGTVLPQGDRVFSFTLPGDMTITMSKKGEEPAKIKVTKGDQTWEVTEEDLSELPDEVRRHVEQWLGPIRRWSPAPGEPMEFDFDFFPDGQLRGAVPKQPSQSPADKRFDEMQKRHERLLERQEEMLKQLDEMRQRFEEFRESRPRLREPQKKEPKAL